MLNQVADFIEGKPKFSIFCKSINLALYSYYVRLFGF